MEMWPALFILLALFLLCAASTKSTDELRISLDRIVKNAGYVVPEYGLHIGSRSYTVDKRTIVIDSSLSKEMQLQVAIHEMAHVLTKEVGHGPEFQRVHQALLQSASKT